jgi:hypothetical protein
MKTFIVHIYKCERTDTRNFVGVAQEVGNGGKKAFTNPEDLLQIMICTDIKEEPDENVSS